MRSSLLVVSALGWAAVDACGSCMARGQIHDYESVDALSTTTLMKRAVGFRNCTSANKKELDVALNSCKLMANKAASALEDAAERKSPGERNEEKERKPDSPKDPLTDNEKYGLVKYFFLDSTELKEIAAGYREIAKNCGGDGKYLCGDGDMDDKDRCTGDNVAKINKGEQKFGLKKAKTKRAESTNENMIPEGPANANPQIKPSQKGGATAQKGDAPEKPPVGKLQKDEARICGKFFDLNMNTKDKSGTLKDNDVCSTVSQAATLLHELSHFLEGTSDDPRKGREDITDDAERQFGYGLKAIDSLKEADERINLAETWSFFAIALDNNCTKSQLDLTSGLGWTYKNGTSVDGKGGKGGKSNQADGGKAKTSDEQTENGSNSIHQPDEGVKSSTDELPKTRTSTSHGNQNTALPHAPGSQQEKTQEGQIPGQIQPPGQTLPQPQEEPQEEPQELPQQVQPQQVQSQQVQPKNENQQHEQHADKTDEDIDKETQQKKTPEKKKAPEKKKTPHERKKPAALTDEDTEKSTT